MISEDDIRDLVEAFDRGRDAWIHGRLEFAAEGFVEQAHDMSIFGPFGGYGQGLDDISPRQEAIVRQFRGGHGTCELLRVITEGDLVIVIMVERNEVLFEGRDEPQPWVLRTTQVFRRDGKRWLRLHRHADPLANYRSMDQTLELARGNS
jgi:ketosteroid isomerase-like protein